MKQIKHGHLPDHYRQAFSDAIEAYEYWKDDEDEPTVEFEDKEITISQACKLVWNCSDILPGTQREAVESLSSTGPRTNSYAAYAQFLLSMIKDDLWAEAEKAKRRNREFLHDSITYDF